MRRPGTLLTLLPAGLLVLAAGCGVPESEHPADPPPASPPAGKIKTIGHPGTTGLDIRYLDTSGTIKTLPVKDFPR